MAHEGGIIARWLAKTLERDAILIDLGIDTGKVWRRKVPEKCPLPFLVFGMEPGSGDENAAGARHLARTRHGVRVYTDDSKPMDSVDKILNRIEAILDHVNAESEGHLLTINGAGMVEGEDIANGKTVRFQGRIWQITAERIGE